MAFSLAVGVYRPVFTVEIIKMMLMPNCLDLGSFGKSHAADQQIIKIWPHIFRAKAKDSGGSTVTPGAVYQTLLQRFIEFILFNFCLADTIVCLSKYEFITLLVKLVALKCRMGRPAGLFKEVTSVDNRAGGKFKTMPVVDQTLNIILGTGGKGNASCCGKKKSVQVGGIVAMTDGIMKKTLNSAEPANVNKGGISLLKKAKIVKVALQGIVGRPGLLPDFMLKLSVI